MKKQDEQFSEADLKKKSKDELVAIAEGMGIDKDGTMETLSKAILKKQEDSASADDEEGIPANEPLPKTEEVTGAPPADAAEAPARSSKKAVDGPEMIQVRSTNREKTVKGGYTRAFRERHPDHPGGEAWIANHRVHTVANTDAVKRAVLVDKTLEIVD